MDSVDIDALASDLAHRATTAGGGRAAHMVHGGHEHVLSQTVIALTAGAVLSEHDNPGEATVQVLAGQVRLRAGEVSSDGPAGTLLIVPQERHSLEAVEDSVVMLTIGRRP